MKNWPQATCEIVQSRHGDDFNFLLGEHLRNKLMAGIFPPWLRFGNGGKPAIGHLRADAFSGKCKFLGLPRIARQSNRVHKSARAVAAPGEIDTQRISRKRKVGSANALLHSTKNSTPAENFHSSRTDAGARVRCLHGAARTMNGRRDVVGIEALELCFEICGENCSLWTHLQQVRERIIHVLQESGGAFRVRGSLRFQVRLKRAQQVYESLQAKADWQKYVRSLREKYPTLRALKEEMDKAGI